MSLLLHAKLLQDLTQQTEAMPLRGELRIEGLAVTLRGEDSNLTNWLQNNFGFLSAACDEAPALEYEFISLSSDQRLEEIIKLNDGDQFVNEVHTRGFDIFKRIQITSERTLDYFPGIGAAWLTDLARNKILLITSSRTPLPTDELRLGLLDVVNRSLENAGWHSFHGAAVELGEHSFLIGGAGVHDSAMLLFDLMVCGGRYLGGDRVLLKCDQGRIQIRGFAQAMTVGLPVAAHFESLRGFIERPDRLIYPQKAFDSERVWSAGEEQVGELPDALKILPHELARTWKTSPAASKGMLKSILLPEIELGQSPRVDPVESSIVQKEFAARFIPPDQDVYYPRWLRISLDYPDAIDPVSMVEAIGQMPAWRLRYGVLNDHESEGFANLARQLGNS